MLRAKFSNTIGAGDSNGVELLAIHAAFKIFDSIMPNIPLKLWNESDSANVVL